MNKPVFPQHILTAADARVLIPTPVQPCLDKMPHCLPVLQCCVVQLHSYAVHADLTDDIPDHIKRYVDRRLAEHEALATILPPVGSVIPWLPTTMGTFLSISCIFQMCY